MEAKPLRLRAQEHIREMMGAYWDECRAAPAEGRPVCYSAMVTPADLLAALDYSVIYPENYAGACGAAGVSGKFCDIAEDAGYSPDLCGYARNSFGSNMSGRPDLSPVGELPKPDLITTYTGCTTHTKWFQELAHYYNVPIVVLDYPFRHDLGAEEFAGYLEYVTEQLRSAVPVLERVAHRSLDLARFAEHIAIASEMAETWVRIIDFARHIPSPITAFDLFLNLSVMACLRGQPRGLAVLKELEQEIRERVDQGIAAMPGEKYRIYWGGIPLWHRLGHLRRTFAAQGANLIVSNYLYSWASPRIEEPDPFRASVIGQIVKHSNNSVQGYGDFLTQLLRDFSIDGAVFQISRTCPIGGLGTADFMERFKRECGIPVTTIEADMVDYRNYVDSRVDSDLATFLDMVSTRPSWR